MEDGIHVKLTGPQIFEPGRCYCCRCGNYLGRDQEGFRGAFADFLHKVLREVAGRTPADEVRDRVRAVYLDNDRLFDLTRPNHSLGNYHHLEGTDLLAVREPLDAWPRILPGSMTKLEREHILAILKEALEGLPEDERSGLVRWLSRSEVPR
jgi:hypothetical protein